MKSKKVGGDLTFWILEIVVVYRRTCIHYIICNSVNLTVIFNNCGYTVVATLMLTNNTHDSDTRTITHDIRTITNCLIFYETQTITLKHANERTYTI